jgi:hypothetical protein
VTPKGATVAVAATASNSSSVSKSLFQEKSIETTPVAKTLPSVVTAKTKDEPMEVDDQNSIKRKITTSAQVT